LLGDKIGVLRRGLDTWIGEGGERLSGGERRTLSLARAYSRPQARWLRLEQPTETLDKGAEEQVVATLDARPRRTPQGAVIVRRRYQLAQR
jgi:ATP-binding cassette subfamily C protein CydC